MENRTGEESEVGDGAGDVDLAGKADGLAVVPALRGGEFVEVGFDHVGEAMEES